MATKISAIYTLITADDKPLKRGLVAARKTAVKGAARIQTALSKINFKAAAVGAVAFGTSMVFATKKFIDLAIEQERVEKRLGAVLKSTGEAAGYNLDQLKAMASAMQEVTTTGDEAIIAGMSVLATFKKIRGQAFERTTMAALDLAEVVGTSLTATMIQLGKALNDPVANLGALSRAGIQFEPAQKKMIKSLWEAGRAAEAQSIILDELESQFGGTAKAARDTFGGALKSLGNTAGDIGEKIGFALMPPLLESIKAISNWVDKNDELINQDMPKYVGKVASSVGDMAVSLGTIVSIYDKLPDGVTGAAGIGIVGRTLFGSWAPAKLALAFTVINDLLKNWGMDVRSTIQDFRELSEAMNVLLGIDQDPIVFRSKVPKGQISPLMDAHVKKLYEVRAAQEDAAAAAAKAIKQQEERVKQLNAEYIATLPTMKTYRDSWEVGKDRTFTDEQLDKLKELNKTVTSVSETTEDSFNSMIDLSERTAWAMQDNFSNIFFDTMQREFKSFNDYLTALLRNIHRVIADIGGQMVTQGLFGKDFAGGGWLDKLFGSSGGTSTIRDGQGGGYGFQHGGYIGEPVRGVGVSGKSYEFHPNEFVTPAGKTGSGVQVDVNVVNNLGVEADVNQTQTFVSPEKIVTDIVLNRKLTSRGFRQGLRS